MKLRMSPELREQLQTMATDNKRSLNAEVVAAIELAWGMHQINAALGSGMLNKANRPAKPSKKIEMSEDEIKSLVEEITDSVLKKLGK